MYSKQLYTGDLEIRKKYYLGIIPRCGVELLGEEKRSGHVQLAERKIAGATLR